MDKIAISSAQRLAIRKETFPDNRTVSNGFRSFFNHKKSKNNSLRFQRLKKPRLFCVRSVLRFIRQTPRTDVRRWLSFGSQTQETIVKKCHNVFCFGSVLTQKTPAFYTVVFVVEVRVNAYVCLCVYVCTFSFLFYFIFHTSVLTQKHAHKDRKSIKETIHYTQALVLRNSSLIVTL